jgi:hypothetical protein
MWNNCHKLKTAIYSKSRRKLSESVLLLHNNDHPHSVAYILEILWMLKLEEMESPDKSINMEPFDFTFLDCLEEV